MKQTSTEIYPFDAALGVCFSILNLARTSKYVNNISVLSISNTEEDS